MIDNIYLGLGGNLGDPLGCFIEARQRLSEHPEIILHASSPLYRTPAVGGPAGQPDYLNAALSLSTELSPQQLLDYCLEIELACGRTRDTHWAARTLDIDLLLFNATVSDKPRLTLPHPRLQDRHFVLLPLVDLAPELRHPRLEKTLSQLLHNLPEPVGITKLSHHW